MGPGEYEGGSDVIPPPLPEEQPRVPKTPVVRQNTSLECDFTGGPQRLEAS